jgi:hypothetical protein
MNVIYRVGGRLDGEIQKRTFEVNCGLNIGGTPTMGAWQPKQTQTSA